MSLVGRRWLLEVLDRHGLLEAHRAMRRGELDRAYALIAASEGDPLVDVEFARRQIGLDPRSLEEALTLEQIVPGLREREPIVIVRDHKSGAGLRLIGAFELALRIHLLDLVGRLVARTPQGRELLPDLHN